MDIAALPTLLPQTGHLGVRRSILASSHLSLIQASNPSVYGNLPNINPRIIPHRKMIWSNLLPVFIKTVTKQNSEPRK